MEFGVLDLEDGGGRWRDGISEVLEGTGWLYVCWRIHCEWMGFGGAVVEGLGDGLLGGLFDVLFGLTRCTIGR